MAEAGTAEGVTVAVAMVVEGVVEAATSAASVDLLDCERLLVGRLRVPEVADKRVRQGCANHSIGHEARVKPAGARVAARVV